jgi:hypothetical protein
LNAALSVSKDYQGACEEIQEILMAPTTTGSWPNCFFPGRPPMEQTAAS